MIFNQQVKDFGGLVYRALLLIIVLIFPIQARAIESESSATLEITGSVKPILILKLLMTINDKLIIDRPTSEILVAGFGIYNNLGGPYQILAKSDMGGGKLVGVDNRNRDTGISYGLRFGSSGDYHYLSSVPKVIYVPPPSYKGTENSINGSDPKLWLYATHPGAGGQMQGLYEDKIIFMIEAYRE